MGIKESITPDEVSAYFPHLKSVALIPTDDGVVDTTYIVKNGLEKVILKKYEKACEVSIAAERTLLQRLNDAGLCVPRYLQSSGSWHLMSFLEGEQGNASYAHLKAVGRFLGRMHRATKRRQTSHTPFSKKVVERKYKRVRRSDKVLALRLKGLKAFEYCCDGIIHGDLFPDNAKISGGSAGVFDFIEAGNGSFAFDAGVTALSWTLKRPQGNRGRVRLFLNSYNRCAPMKLSWDRLLQQMRMAALFYAMQRYERRIQEPQSRLDHRPMLKRHASLQRGRI